MSDGGRSQNTVLNWRGPLLAAGIFAAAFGVVLLMAYQNQSNTSDVGSSLREDPYGASLLFDSFNRAGYRVKRSQDEDSLADENAPQTTAFLIGGDSSEEWIPEETKLKIEAKLRTRLENFLARGGRVVLIGHAWAMKSESQGWEVDSKWEKTTHDSGAVWAAPDPRAMPAGSEMMYLASETPWLSTDGHWTSLYFAPNEVAPNQVASNEADKKPDASSHVYMAMRRAGGDGELIAASQESFLLNEAIKTHPNPVLLDFLAGGRPVIWVDETLHGLHQEQGVLWLLHRYRLQAALMLFWATLLFLLWSMSGDLVRRPARARDAQVLRQGEDAGVAARRLLQRSIAPAQVVAECWEQFRRRSPHDAQAISEDPGWGPRLRAALAQPPLAGYQELQKLIAERRASARGLIQARRDAPDIATQNKIPEETLQA